jgi:acyl-CoA dehydrogenase family protein 9
VVFVRGTRMLAQAADRILRKHGKQIIGKQFASRRFADIMIDLFVLVCTLSRVQASVKKNGADAAAKEIEIARVFAAQAGRRIDDNLARVDDNEDELIKALAMHTVEAGGFGWDVR